MVKCPLIDNFILLILMPAAPGVDFISSFSPAVLLFTAGTSLTQSPLTSSTQCFTFPIINDNLVEVVEDIQFGLINPTGLIDPAGLNSQATVFINIDEREYVIKAKFHLLIVL